MILKVGLTGGIASGKSTVARILGALGCFVVDADTVVRELYVPGAVGHRAIVETYGADIVKADGEIDRSELSRRALKNAESALALNHLIHPLVMTRIEEIVRNEETRTVGSHMIAVVEATLLLEAGGRKTFDRMIVVDLDPRLQIERGVARGLSAEEVERRMARQMNREERLRNADYVIENGGDVEELNARTRHVFGHLLHDLVEKTSR